MPKPTKNKERIDALEAVAADLRESDKAEASELNKKPLTCIERAIAYLTGEIEA